MPARRISRRRLSRGGDVVNRLQRLHDAGVSIWLDTLSRDLLESGEFAALVDDFAVTGATSNPTIFAKAITGSDRYDEQLRRAGRGGVRRPAGAVLRRRARRRPPRGRDSASGVRAQRRARRLRLVRVHAGRRRRRRGDDRPGARALAAARSAQRADQGAGDPTPASARSRS